MPSSGLPRHRKSLDLSPDRIQEADLYQQTEADPETISISTVSSIEEEESATSSPAPLILGSEKDEVFLPTREANGIISSRETSVDAQTVECAGSEVSGGVCSAGNQIRHAEFANGELEASPSQQASVAQIGQHCVRTGTETAVIRDWDRRELDHVHNDRGQLPSGFSDARHAILSAKDDEPHSDTSLTSSGEKFSPGTADSKSEVIPPLIERLSALGVGPAPIDDDGGWSSHDASSVRNLISEASRLKIASVKER